MVSVEFAKSYTEQCSNVLNIFDTNKEKLTNFYLKLD